MRKMYFEILFDATEEDLRNLFSNMVIEFAKIIKDQFTERSRALVLLRW
jgi:hypothetical protein